MWVAPEARGLKFGERLLTALEYLADEMGARSIGRPATMASALLKIEGRGPPPKASWGLSIVGFGSGILSRYPPLKERVQRLLLLSDLLGASANGGMNT